MPTSRSGEGERLNKNSEFRQQASLWLWVCGIRCQKQWLRLLFLFYSQVMGVSASLVSAALAIALVFDAISDPLIGFFLIIRVHDGGVVIPTCMAPLCR